MIIYYIAIISFILVYWFQYPLIKNDIVPDNTPLYKKIFNTYKLPVIIVCKILLLYNIFSDMNKCKSNDLDLDVFAE